MTATVAVTVAGRAKSRAARRGGGTRRSGLPFLPVVFLPQKEVNFFLNLTVDHVPLGIHLHRVDQVPGFLDDDRAVLHGAAAAPDRVTPCGRWSPWG